MALQPMFEPWLFIQFPTLFYTDGRTPWTVDQPTYTQHNRNAQTSITRVGFELTIPVFNQAMEVHALDSRPLGSALRKMVQAKYVSIFA
jgi:hypothetical protein